MANFEKDLNSPKRSLYALSLYPGGMFNVPDWEVKYFVGESVLPWTEQFRRESRGVVVELRFVERSERPESF